MRIPSIIILTLLIGLSSCISVVKGPKKAYNEVRKHDVTFDAIIVPGIPFENNTWDSIMKARVVWAYVLYKNGVTRNIIFSGNAVYSPYYESKIMGLYAQALGVPAEHIFYDTLARHSTENVFYSYLVARENNFKTLALATDPFQSALLRKFTFTRFGTIMYHMPFVMDSVKKYNDLAPTIDPTPAKRTEAFSSITDEQSSFRRFFGTMGGDIDWSNYEGRKLPPL